jgi:hypothetical protein
MDSTTRKSALHIGILITPASVFAYSRGLIGICFITVNPSSDAQILRVSRWWQVHSQNTANIRLGQIMFFDMACGSLIID